MCNYNYNNNKKVITKITLILRSVKSLQSWVSHTHTHTHTHTQYTRRDKVIAISAPPYYVNGADNYYTLTFYGASVSDRQTDRQTDLEECFGRTGIKRSILDLRLARQVLGRRDRHVHALNGEECRQVGRVRRHDD